MKLSALAALIACAPSFGQPPADLSRKFAEAGRRIVRLPPNAFPELPGNIVTELERRRCAIPQHSYSGERHNVIRGRFAKAGQLDWAVLCSSGGSSSILVFWNSSAKNPAEIARRPDAVYLQSDVGDKINYSRGIFAVGGDYIVAHYKSYGGPKPPPIDHQGIDDAFLEKASITHYFHRGRWLQLTGAD